MKPAQIAFVFIIKRKDVEAYMQTYANSFVLDSFFIESVPIIKINKVFKLN